MTTKALLVPLEAKPGKEADVEKFLRSALPLVQQEPGTTMVRDPPRTIQFRHLRRVPGRGGPPGPPVWCGCRGADGASRRAVRGAAGHAADRRPGRQAPRVTRRP